MIEQPTMMLKRVCVAEEAHGLAGGAAQRCHLGSFDLPALPPIACQPLFLDLSPLGCKMTVVHTPSRDRGWTEGIF